MPSQPKKSSPAALIQLSAAARVVRARRRKAQAEAIGMASEPTESNVRSLDYAIAHPRERVVVKGPQYSVIVPELKSSKIAEGDLKRLLREIVK